MSNNEELLPTREGDQQQHRLAKKIKNFIYNPHDVIGSGFSSQVFKGINQNNLQSIAIKVIELSKIQNQVEKYLLNNQITALRLIKHKNVLHTIDILMTKNNVYIITQFCEEGDLFKLIDKRKKANEGDQSKKLKSVLSQLEALNIMKDILEGYKILEEKGVLHRDLKSANIFLAKGLAKIADFGFCQIISQTSKKPKLLYNVGSPAYMSPQSYKENIYSHKSDIWSIGIILYEMLFGETPDKTLTYDQMSARLMSGKFNGINSQSIQNILSKIFVKDLNMRIDSHHLLELVNNEIRRLHQLKNQTTIRSTIYQHNAQINNTRFSQIMNQVSPMNIVDNHSEGKKVFTKINKPHEKNSDFIHKHLIGNSPKTIKQSPNLGFDVMKQRQWEGNLRPCIEMLLFLYRLLKLVSETSIQAAQMTRLIIFRHRSFIDQYLPSTTIQDQSYQEFQYLKSKFDESYLQKQMNFPSNHPTVILLNQHTNSMFQNQATIAVYQNIFKQGCNSCQSYIFEVGTVDESVIDFNKIGTMWDYLMIQYQILGMIGEGKSILEIINKIPITKIVKEQPKRLIHKHYELLKLKNDLITNYQKQKSTQFNHN